MVTQDWVALFGSQWGYDVAQELLQGMSDPRLLDATKQFKLTRTEALAIRAYTLGVRGKTSPYEQINSFFRVGSPSSECITGLCADLVAGVAKAPAFEGPVFRKTTLPDDIWRTIKDGSTFSDPGFLSTSSSPDIFNGRDLMLIFSESGHNIAEFSAIHAENEVLFLPNTQFLVSRVKQHGSMLIVEMDEAP